MEFQRDPPGDAAILGPQYAQGLEALVRLTGTQRLQLLGELGTLARQLRDYPAAIGHFKAAVALARDLEDARLLAANQVRLGVALHHYDQLAPAIGLFEAVIAAPDCGYRDFALQHLGKLHVEQKQFTAARDCFTQALELRQAKGDPGLIASTRAALAGLDQLETAERKKRE
ncbi:MAG: hypothetical protein ACAI44_38140 [Candidatus Sericytochromatia bacterium]